MGMPGSWFLISIFIFGAVYLISFPWCLTVRDISIFGAVYLIYYPLYLRFRDISIFMSSRFSCPVFSPHKIDFFSPIHFFS